MTAEASACFSFTKRLPAVREDSSSRNSPTTGRSDPDCLQSSLLWVRFPGGRQKKTLKLVAIAIQRIIMIHQKFDKIYTKQYIDEFLANLKKQKAKHEELQRRILAENALIEAAYKKVFTDGATVESTPHNIYVLLSFLNTQNWGMWNLPKMTIGYKCNQYDCDGKQATTIILDKPILYKGEMLSHFQVGAPRGHLTQYARLSFN